MQIIQNFSIPSPTLNPTVANCNYFKVRYRMINPTQGLWIDYVGKILLNSFSLQLEDQKIYEIEATMVCCDGGISSPTTIHHSTITSNGMIYVVLEKLLGQDTCSTTVGVCRDCIITKQVKIKFYSDINASIPLDVTGKNLIIKSQYSINMFNQPVQSDLIVSGTEFGYPTLSEYQETCINGVYTLTTQDMYIINGIGETVPYTVIAQPSLINGTINLINGVLPVTIYAPNADGTITATAGSTVNIVIKRFGTDLQTSIIGNINSIPFSSTLAVAPYTQTVIMPLSGVISWNIRINTGITNQSGTIELF